MLVIGMNHFRGLRVHGTPQHPLMLRAQNSGDPKRTTKGHKLHISKHLHLTALRADLENKPDYYVHQTS